VEATKRRRSVLDQNAAHMLQFNRTADLTDHIEMAIMPAMEITTAAMRKPCGGDGVDVEGSQCRGHHPLAKICMNGR
jgi:hypothetical protein